MAARDAFLLGATGSPDPRQIDGMGGADPPTSKVTVATACPPEGSPAAGLAVVPGGRSQTLDIDHPTGATARVVELDEGGTVVGAGMVRTAGKLSDGTVFAS